MAGEVLVIAKIKQKSGTFKILEVMDLDGLRQSPALFVAGTLAVGENKCTYPLLAPFNGTIKKVWLIVKTAPVGANIVVKIKKEGTSITTDANRPLIGAGNRKGSATIFSVTAVTEGDEFTIDVDQVGSSTAGSDLSAFICIEPSQPS